MSILTEVAREAQRNEDIAILVELKDSLPKGHPEIPGLIRAIELLRVGG